MQYNNEFYLASAGAGKTTKIVDFTLNNPNLKILLTTYTTLNTNLLRTTIKEINGIQPSNITVMSWFSFLLTECIRPYQNFIYNEARIENLYFTTYQSAKFQRRENPRLFYCSDATHIYSDKMSDFAYHCNKKSEGLIIRRLEQLFDVFILDETQDISGWDFCFIKLLLCSKIKVIMVGDPRQKTYSTSQSNKSKKYSDDIRCWFEKLEKQKLGCIQWLNQSYRCIQVICDFADAIFPDFPKTKSLNTSSINHQGIYILKSKNLYKYYERYKPQILIHDKKSIKKARGLSASNFGAVKGQTYDHVVIIPTEPIKEYLISENLLCIDKGKEKLYVAVTRARFSVAFLTDCNQNINIPEWDAS